MSYDPQVIVTFADRLYKQAGSIVATYTVLGALAGAVFGAALESVSSAGLTGAVVAAVIAGAIGYSIGQQKAFALRLQAQVALCQVQIEASTRRIPQRV